MIPPTVAAALTDLYAAPAAAVETTRDARQSRVWRVETARGPIYAKQHNTDGKYRRERDALRRLHGMPWAPALHGWHDGMRLLAIAPCPGDAIGDGTHDDSHGIQAWHLAGETLAALHRLPCLVDEMPLSDAIPRRLAGWRARARGALPAATIDALAARIGDGAAFAGARRVFCHRDYAPRNWRLARPGGKPRREPDETPAAARRESAGVLVARRGRATPPMPVARSAQQRHFPRVLPDPSPPAIVRAFDFEHAGPDAAEVDLLRLYDGPFIDRPEREGAFLAGYGTAPDPARLDALLALHALATATWGRLHGDPVFIERGERLIARLLRHQPQVPGPPLNGPTTSAVIQPE